MTTPRLTRFLETAIYVDDVATSRAWYERVLGMRALNPASDDPRICALGMPGGQVFLLFKKGGSVQTLRFEGGTIPPSDSQGTTHFAFAIEESELAAWRAHLAAEGVAIEGEMRWERGGTSVYFRDPDGHLAELVTPGVWPTY